MLSRHFQTLFYRWLDWAGANELKSWIQGMNTPELKLGLLMAFVSASTVNGHQVVPFLDAKSLEEFTDLEELNKAVAEASVTGVDKKAELSKKLLQRSISLKKRGASYTHVEERGEPDIPDQL